MKKLRFCLLAASLLSLSACSFLDQSASVSQTETSQSSQTSSQTTSVGDMAQAESTSAADLTSSALSEQTQAQATDASFNGVYYSVQGKYGEVIIVNKKHPLAADYAPGEDPTALAAFQSLLADMTAQGYAISSSYSGFRSYDYQASLYQSYVANDGQANADRYSARPGYSEHQTGLAFDILDSSGALLQEPQAVAWLEKNAHRYGFVVRYLANKEAITGYMAETWHIRYIGQEAEDIYQSGLTLEEYYGVAGGGYSN